ncbi:hypothetical protein EVAR_50473_1 [Eumeta japonica]|uniref:Uncharacterized protein n=1 Tax=Eumeta variegata TaxID=151549 RepID=A0A4C1XRQ9_EUMVA|nr:hypothetical protein EVAR_50458_1 [Eumeta japonica]GBP66636.1 hypothetical protein EVAR_50461_1 [Eumeta japonica]GBP66639.1 hypothetical protein EVAR_50464_1 [Eumeta japonica]GBP66642.1 hypothetical protein EVAR_50467_1 [Eumeta japonica]GBP66645.1 hypothetical protein EVAR_50470_1 [Eumeta japonica]
MMKLVVLALCLFVAVAYASPVFEEETAPESARLPMGAERACTFSVCLSLCRALGYPNGICLDANTCFCWR